MSDRVTTDPLGFAFVDLCGFTRLAEQHGDQQAAEEIATFRRTLTQAAKKADVTIHRWLGDGAMLVATDPVDLITTARELDVAAGAEPGGLATRAGMAMGPAHRLDDDYIGRAPNLASRLCDRAGPHQILADATTVALLESIDIEMRSEKLRGIPDPVTFADVGMCRHTQIRVTDPVCGMELDPAMALSTTIGGETTWFCSAACAGRWNADAVR